jgi:hypothetical protein
MVGFKVISSMKESSFDKLPISTLALAVGDLIEQEAGIATWTKCDATSNHWTRKAIVMEAVTTAATSVLAYELDGAEKVEAQCANTASAADIGDRMILTDENTVNNSHSDVTGGYPAFIMDKIGSTTTSIIGRVMVGSGVDPDATG